MKTIICFNTEHKPFLLFFLILVTLQAAAQNNDHQNWTSVSAKFSLSKKSDLSISELVSLSPANNFECNFFQTAIGLSYDINKKVTVKVGDQMNYVVNSSRPLRNRVFINTSFNNKFSRYVRAEHAIQFEMHDKNERRYAHRLIFRNSLNLRKRFSALKLYPSVSYWLYYNMGGAPIQYYNKDGSTATSQTPDGFHRGRLYFTLNSKLSKVVRLSTYYMIQREFNLFSAEFRNINEVNPVTGNISRPFDDGKVIGLSLQFVFGRD